jgi:hypothetical protein
MLARFSSTSYLSGSAWKSIAGLIGTGQAFVRAWATVTS